MQPPNLNFTDLVTGNGQQVLLEWFRTYRDQHGAEWLADIKAEWPFGSWVVELVTTKTADEAFAIIKKENWLAGAFEPQLKQLHAVLLAEIDKKTMSVLITILKDGEHTAWRRRFQLYLRLGTLPLHFVR